MLEKFKQQVKSARLGTRKEQGRFRGCANGVKGPDSGAEFGGTEYGAVNIVGILRT